MVKDVPIQYRDGIPYPASPEARELLSNFKNYQLLLADFRGTTRPRSIIQMNLYWACCNYVAQNVREYPLRHKEYQHYIRWSKKELVDKQVRKALHFVDDSLTVRIDKETFEFHYRSIAVKNLKHIEACGYFDRAFELLALRLGITVDELIRATKATMFAY